MIGHKEFVYLADAKAASLQTRAQIAKAGGIYCFPLPMSGHTPEMLKQWVLDPSQPIAALRLPAQAEEEPPAAQGFEMELGKLWLNCETHKWFHWHERHLVVYSEALAQSQRNGLEQRLNRAETGLTKLASKPPEDAQVLLTQAQAILKQHRVTDFISLQVTLETRQLTPYQGRGRPSAKRPQVEETQHHLCLTFQRQARAVEQAQHLAGWRLYVTNALTTRLTLAQALSCYRQQWQLEHGFHRFKRGRLPALPIYFQNPNRIVGLMFLLTIALRVFTLIEFIVRRHLTQASPSLAGLYDGNPKRTTQQPTTEQLLKAFRDITLYCLADGSVQLTPLTPLQSQILTLMNIPKSVYAPP